jgi:hypothetical protein
VKVAIFVLLPTCILIVSPATRAADNIAKPFFSYEFSSGDVKSLAKLDQAIRDAKVNVSGRGFPGKEGVDCRRVAQKGKAVVTYFCTKEKRVFNAITASAYSALLPQNIDAVMEVRSANLTGDVVDQCTKATCSGPDHAPCFTPCLLKTDPNWNVFTCYHDLTPNSPNPEPDPFEKGDPLHECVDGQCTP